MSIFRCSECGYTETIRGFLPARCPDCGRPARSAPPPTDSSGTKVLIGLGIAALVLVLLIGLGAATAVYLAYRVGKSATQGMVSAVTPPGTAKDALADLQGGNPMRVSVAMSFLKTAPVDRALQPQIAAELERYMTTNQFEAWAAADALVTWATPKQVPTLIQASQAQDSPVRSLAFKALGQTKDPRALPVLLGGLTDVHVCRDAADGLILFGSAVESELIKYVDHSNIFAQREAHRVMKSVGTAKSLPALQAARDRLANSRMGIDRKSAGEIDDVIRSIQSRNP